MGDKACASPAPVYTCSYPECNLKFSRPSRLEQHFRIHTGEKPYKCDHPSCGKEYARPAHLKRHKSNAHVERQTVEVQICVEKGCRAVFETLQGLQKHCAAKHSAAEDKHVYKCDHDGCSQKFKKHHQLTKHKCEHTGETPLPFVCTHEGCGKKFDQGSHLKRHMKTHEGYPCKEDGCNEKFKHFNLLRKHMAIEHPKTFICTVCDKAFVRRKYLNDHEKLHSAERTVYECPRENCPRFYFNTRNLEAHIRSYHEGRRVACIHDGCERTFATKQKMQQHLKFHDPNKPLPKPKKKRKQDTVTSKLVTLMVRNRKEENKREKQKMLCIDTSDDSDDSLDFLSESEDEETDMEENLENNSVVQLNNSDSVYNEKMEVSDDYSKTKPVSNDESLSSNGECKQFDDMPNDVAVSERFISHSVASNTCKTRGPEKEVSVIRKLALENCLHEVPAIEDNGSNSIRSQDENMNSEDENMNSENNEHDKEEIVMKNIASDIENEGLSKDHVKGSNGVCYIEQQNELIFDAYGRLVEK